MNEYQRIQCVLPGGDHVEILVDADEPTDIVRVVSDMVYRGGTWIIVGPKHPISLLALSDTWHPAEKK